MVRLVIWNVIASIMTSLSCQWALNILYTWMHERDEWEYDYNLSYINKLWNKETGTEYWNIIIIIMVSKLLEFKCQFTYMYAYIICYTFTSMG